MTAMNDAFRQHVERQLEEIRAAGTYKSERVISTPQAAHSFIDQQIDLRAKVVKYNHTKAE